MTDRLTAERDDLARVVRLLDTAEGSDTFHELDPDHAISLGETLIRRGRELQTEQATLAADQLTLSEGSDDGTESLAGMLDRVEATDREPLDIGDVVNPNDPLDW